MKTITRIKRTFLLFILPMMLLSFDIMAQQKVGVLVMAHGGKPEWEATVINAVKPLKEKYTVEIAFGMADPKTLQEAVNKLEKEQVKLIIAVPLFVSSHSVIIRQAEYLFGIRKELADEPLIMSHGGSSHGSGPPQSHGHGGSGDKYAGGMEQETTLDPVVTNAQVIMTRPLDADPLVAGILHDRVLEFSASPETETVIFVAHGPDSEEDNNGWLRNLDSLGKQVQAKQIKEKGKGFKQVDFITVRDDANKKIYNQAKKQLREMVETYGKDSKVLVVPVLLSTGGIERGIVKRLEGLTYTWVNKALLPHDNITKFIESSVQRVTGKQ